MLADQLDYVIGVDPHRDTRALAIGFLLAAPRRRAHLRQLATSRSPARWLVRFGPARAPVADLKAP